MRSDNEEDSTCITQSPTNNVSNPELRLVAERIETWAAAALTTSNYPSEETTIECSTSRGDRNHGNAADEKVCFGMVC